MKTKYHSFNEFKKNEYKNGNNAQIATQLMRLYKTAKEFSNPTILELGTSRGASTTIFLKACSEKKGKLVSIDIDDCSDIIKSSNWTFIQSDSTDTEYILSKAPHLKKGIDILYIDSLHTMEHVKKELTGWFPYMKKGSHIFFDDVDANPYRKGSRKDSFNLENEWNKIKDYIKSFFYANENSLYLDIMYGSTGLAHYYKLSPIGTIPLQEQSIKHRKKTLLNMLRYDPRMILSSIKQKFISRKSS